VAVEGSQQATRAWIALADAPGLTGDQLGPLLAHHGDASSLAAAMAAPDPARMAAALAWLEGGNDRHLISITDPRYPRLLAATQTAPVALFVRGDPDCLSLPQLGIVGSRKATAAGMENAEAFAAHLAGCGLVVTSGLALGIDTAAHGGALAAKGRTIAVLGTGPERIYPRTNEALAARIATEGGALVSEFLPGVPALKENFPRRNRIISGLSLGTLVVEAGIQSGALITARRAIEQGREVFAIPGSIHNPLAKGCHRLIREGAKLVESAEHILEELGPLLSLTQASLRAGDDHPTRSSKSDEAVDRRLRAAMPETRERDIDYGKLLDALGWDPATVDMLVLRSGLTAGEVSSMLLILELDGTVQPLAGGRYQRTR